jgi:thioredoxin-like negative regulator of GroEL
MLRAWVSELAQHVMLLKWSGRAEEVPPLVEEGSRLVEQLLSLSPDRASTIGVVSDFLIEVGRVKEAQALLARALEQGVKADYFSSYVFASLLAGDDAAVLAQRGEAEAKGDSQAMLAVALALARTGQPRDAADVLRAWGPRIAATPLQWPRGCLAPVIASMPAELVEPVRGFSEALEAALPSDDRPGQEAALRGLADALAR